MKKYGKIFMNGIIDENPTFRMVLGMCPTLAITTAASNGIGMGLAVTFVLIFSNLVISLLRKAIPDQIRIPAFIVVIATFVTIVQLIIKAFLPALDASLGVFIPLIVVNCIIFGRAEAFAFKNKPLASAVDGPGHGSWLYAGHHADFFHPRAVRRGHAVWRAGHAGKLSADGHSG